MTTTRSVCHLFLVALFLCGSLAQQSCDAETGMCDTHERCPVWAAEGECRSSRQYMRQYCPGSCAEINNNNNAKKREAASSPTRNNNNKAVCRDKLERCAVWAKVGECDANPQHMHKNCPVSCNVCDQQLGQDDDKDDDEDPKCRNLHTKCNLWAEVGECDKNSNWMHKNCAKACNVCESTVAAAAKDDNESTTTSQRRGMQQDHGDDETLSEEERIEKIMEKSKEFGERQLAEGDQKEETLKRISNTFAYMASEAVQRLPSSVLSGCENRHELCSFWAVLGECEANKSYMATNCAPACRSCDMLDFNTRCPPLPEGTRPALEPGDLDAMFTRIVNTAPGNQTNASISPDIPPYTVTVHSSPADNGRPWVITFDNFVTEEEAKALIQHGYEEGYKRSEDVGQRKFDGSYDSVQSKGRTSENAWCSAKEGCRFKEIPKRIMDRISAVTGIPPENSEDFQLLKYEPGQFYNKHHDYIPHQKDRNCGPRILTFFLYLSDVEEGGGTDFPDLGITVMPKRGRAVLWPSITNESPLNKDRRMEHQALPVEKGVKFAANAWIHMYDYLAPQAAGCN